MNELYDFDSIGACSSVVLKTATDLFWSFAVFNAGFTQHFQQQISTKLSANENRAVCEPCIRER